MHTDTHKPKAAQASPGRLTLFFNGVLIGIVYCILILLNVLTAMILWDYVYSETSGSLDRMMPSMAFLISICTSVFAFVCSLITSNRLRRWAWIALGLLPCGLAVLAVLIRAVQ